MAMSTEPDSAALGSHVVLELSDSTKDHSKIHQWRLTETTKKYLAQEASSSAPSGDLAGKEASF